MKLPKIRELGEALKAIFTGPYTLKFPAGPPAETTKYYRGKPVPDDDYCVGCTACASVCPSKAIEVEDDPKKGIRKIIRRYDKCIYCGQCERYCLTEKGVHLTQEWDLAGFKRDEMRYVQEKELVVCDRCGEVISTKQHLLWLAHKLGEMAYGNYPLILVSYDKLQIVKPVREKIEKEKPVTRQDFFRILCPKCKHIVILYDKYAIR